MNLLCKHGQDFHEWYVLSASDDAETLKQEAERRNVAEYEAEHREWLDRGKTGPYPLPLNDPRRDGYRTFFVQEVPDWPALQEA